MLSGFPLRDEQDMNILCHKDHGIFGILSNTYQRKKKKTLNINDILSNGENDKLDLINSLATTKLIKNEGETVKYQTESIF